MLDLSRTYSLHCFKCPSVSVTSIPVSSLILTSLDVGSQVKITSCNGGIIFPDANSVYQIDLILSRYMSN